MDDLKAKLLAPRAETASGMPEADVEVPGIGTVRVRGLSRLEAMHMQAAKDGPARDRRLIALGMVNPAMTEAEAGQWQRASTAAELEPVTKKMQELSGMLADSAKEVVREFIADPEAEFRDVPSGTAPADADAAAGDA